MVWLKGKKAYCAEIVNSLFGLYPLFFVNARATNERRLIFCLDGSISSPPAPRRRKWSPRSSDGIERRRRRRKGVVTATLTLLPLLHISTSAVREGERVMRSLYRVIIRERKCCRDPTKLFEVFASEPCECAGEREILQSVVATSEANKFFLPVRSAPGSSLPAANINSTFRTPIISGANS